MEVPSNNVQMVAPGRNSDTPDPKYLMMAAAQMHSEGRLFESGKRELSDKMLTPTPSYMTSAKSKMDKAAKASLDISKAVRPDLEDK